MFPSRRGRALGPSVRSRFHWFRVLFLDELTEFRRDAVEGLRQPPRTQPVRGRGYYEPVADCVRSDPLDPKTSRHAGQCEFASATDAAVLRLILKVKDGAGDGYWWVECGACDTAWQVPYYAESVG